MKILVVEDDDLARDAFREILTRDGFEVITVENAIAGFAEIQRNEFAAIICDFRLPFMGGETFFDEVKADNPELSKRFVFVTGYAHDPTVGAQLKGTGQPVLPKPFDFKHFIATVREITEPNQDPS